MVGFRLLALSSLVVVALGVPRAEFGCKTDATGYYMMWSVYPNGQNIRYVYGGISPNAGCLLVKEDDGVFRLTVPVDPVNPTPLMTACSIQTNPNGSRNFEMTIYTKSIELGFLATDRRFKETCHFNGSPMMEVSTPEAIVLRGNMPNIPRQANATHLNTVANFQLISAETGQPLQEVNFMQRVHLRFTMIDNFQGSKSIRVRDCYADGVSVGSVPLLTGTGCPTDNQILSGPFIGDVTSQDSPVFEMFMINGASNIVFRCLVELCPEQECVTNCTAPATGRKRRDAPVLESARLYAVVRVHNESDTGEVGRVQLLNSGEVRTCTNWPYLVAIAALALVLIVTLGFALLFFTQRSRDCRVGDMNHKPMA